jgi:hypothetical protein
MNETIIVADNLAHPAAGPDMTLNRAPSHVPLNFPGEKGSKRKIRFASTVSQVVCRVLSRDDFSEDEKTEYWIESGEFDRLQSRARMVAEAVKNHGSAYVDCIEDSYKEAQQLSEFMVDDDEIDLFFRDPSCYTNKMEIWAEADYGQRGLEKYISPLQKSQRTSEIRETRLMVVVASKMGVSDDELADLYAALSWMAFIYSRMVGHADYTAAYFAKFPSEQPKPAQMPPLKEETHSDPAPIQNLALKVAERLKPNTPSQDPAPLKQTHQQVTPLRDSRCSRQKTGFESQPKYVLHHDEGPWAHPHPSPPGVTAILRRQFRRTLGIQFVKAVSRRKLEHLHSAGSTKEATSLPASHKSRRSWNHGNATGNGQSCYKFHRFSHRGTYESGPTRAFYFLGIPLPVLVQFLRSFNI